MSAIPGTCRYCGCTAENPCSVYPYTTDATCGWLDKKRTVCNAQKCADAWKSDKRKESERRQALVREERKTSVDIHLEICGRKPRRKNN
jgi:hypothetical protein